MSFRTTAVLTAIVTFVLGAGYFLAGPLLVARWGIEPTESVLLLGRRIGAAYLGLALIFFLARSLARSPARSALSSGAALTCSLLSLLGVSEYSAGRAAPPILVSAALEAFLALAFLRILILDRRATGERR
ncbi:MAG: hypothetical protein M5U13_11905 [Thermoanaerobaculia bacterium]|nr:hypothetical protein [Thermoanaerobaculia bacterium]